MSPGLPALERPLCDILSPTAAPVPCVPTATSTPSCTLHPQTPGPVPAAPTCHSGVFPGCPQGPSLPGHQLSPGAGGEGKGPITRPTTSPQPTRLLAHPFASCGAWGHPDFSCPLPKASTRSRVKGLHSPCSRYSSKSMAVSPTSSSGPPQRLACAALYFAQGGRTLLRAALISQPRRRRQLRRHNATSP